MAAVAGKNGTVSVGSAVAQISGWSLNEEVGDGEFVSSNTSGWASRVAGPGKWNGSFRQKYDGSIPVTVGQTVTLTLTIDSGGTNDAYTGNAMILSIAPAVDLETASPVEVVYTFGGLGNLTTRPS